jgi:hypothetical protein
MTHSHGRSSRSSTTASNGLNRRPSELKGAADNADKAARATYVPAEQVLQTRERNDVRVQAAAAFHPVLLVQWPARTPDVNPWPFGKVYCPPHNEPGR